MLNLKTKRVNMKLYARALVQITNTIYIIALFFVQQFAFMQKLWKKTLSLIMCIMFISRLPV